MCSGVPLAYKSLIYKDLLGWFSWNTDSVPVCSKVFRFRGGLNGSANRPQTRARRGLQRVWMCACSQAADMMHSTGGRYRVAAPAVPPAGQVQASKPGNQRAVGPRSACQLVGLAPATGTPSVVPGQQARAGVGTLVPLLRAGQYREDRAPAVPPAEQAQQIARAVTGSRRRAPRLWASGARVCLGARASWSGLRLQ